MKDKLTFRDFQINKVILYLTTSDIFTWALMAVIQGFAGLYLAQKLDSDVIKIIGFGTGIFSFANALFQIPVGLVIDKIKKDRDDILVLFTGNLFMGMPFIFFPLINSEYVYYFLQFIVGMGTAMNLVSWRKLFAKNLDKGREGLNYAVYETIIGVSIGIFSLAAGLIANVSEEYFDAVIVAIGIIMMTSGLWVLLILGVDNRKQ
jgi:MFS family permease